MSTATTHIETKKQLVPALRFKEFDGEWKETTLGNLFTFKNGLNSDKEKYGSGMKFINVLDIIGNNVITNDSIIGKVEVTEKELEKNEVIYGDVLFQRSSETREEVGQANIYVDENKSAVFGGFVIRGRKKEDYNPYFMNYLLKTSPARKEITTKSGGSTRYNVGQASLSEVFVNLTDVPEQQKIASFLSAVDGNIQQLTKKKELLEQYKKGVMQQLFSGQLRFKDENGNPYPDWEQKQLSEVLDQQIREVPKPSINYLAIGIRSHVKGTFQKPNSDPKKIAMEKLFVVKENDLVVNITFAWEGAIAIVKKEDDGGLVSHRFPTYTFKTNQTSKEYFKQVIIDKKFRFTLDLISPGGAGRNRVLSKKEFMKIKWAFPCIAEQQKIATYLSRIDTKIEAVNNQITQTQTFKKGLLQQMFV
jgi:type I restriction enzyme S subunit